MPAGGAGFKPVPEERSTRDAGASRPFAEALARLVPMEPTS